MTAILDKTSLQNQRENRKTLVNILCYTATRLLGPSILDSFNGFRVSLSLQLQCVQST